MLEARPGIKCLWEKTGVGGREGEGKSLWKEGLEQVETKRGLGNEREIKEDFQQ